MSERRGKRVAIPTKPATPDEWVEDGAQRASKAPTERTQRLTLDIPRTLHKRLKRMALEEDTTILALATAWFERAVAAWERAAVRGGRGGVHDGDDAGE